MRCRPNAALISRNQKWRSASFALRLKVKEIPSSCEQRQ
jgi:hypothetical protein